MRRFVRRNRPLVFFLLVCSVCSRKVQGRHSLSTVARLRGGGWSDSSSSSSSSSPIELNPNYYNNALSGLGEKKPLRLQDVDEKGNIALPHNYYIETQTYSVDTSSARQQVRRRNPPLSLRQQLQQVYVTNGAAVINTVILCMAVFIAWQVPSLTPALGEYFVCSRQNMQRNMRAASIVLSAVSHSGLVHLMYNLLALMTFGPTVNDVIGSASLSWPLWPLLLGSALTGSAFFLVLDRGRHNGCMGLSGVTLALLAVYARLLPKQMLGFIIGILPVRMPASNVLNILFVWSILGTLSPRPTIVAHSTHLGGLAFGVLYYEAWKRRHQLRHGAYVRLHQAKTFIADFGRTDKTAKSI